MPKRNVDKMQYRCRKIAPGTPKEWKVMSADSPSEAAHLYHWRLVEQGIDPGFAFMQELEPNRKEAIFFARIEVATFGTWVSRVYHARFWRKGGVKPPNPPTIEDVAKAVGWTKDPKELLEPGWEHEESWEDAEKRKWSK